MNKYAKNIHSIQEWFEDGKLMSLFRQQLNQKNHVNVVMAQVEKYYSKTLKMKFLIGLWKKEIRNWL